MRGVEVGAGMVGIAYTDEGARNLFTSAEITSLADVKGKKIRVPETTLMMDTMSALGAEPTPISYSELYSSLQTGVVDGAENGYPGYDSNKFYEVAPYYLLDAHTFSPGIILMAEAQWAKLSPEDQEILLEAGRKASEWNKAAIEDEEKALRASLEGKGVTIIERIRRQHRQHVRMCGQTTLRGLRMFCRQSWIFSSKEPFLRNRKPGDRERPCPPILSKGKIQRTVHAFLSD